MLTIFDSNHMERQVLSVEPDPSYPGFIKLQFRRHVEWMELKEFLTHNPEQSELVKDAPTAPSDVVGVVSSATKTTLKDTSQKLEPKKYVGMWVWISRGRGEGQKRTVISNTHNQFTIDKPWDTVPNKTSQYVISYNVQEVRDMGNSLPAQDLKDLEREAIRMDRQRGRLNREFKYLKPEDLD